MDHPCFHFCTGPHRSRVNDDVRLAGKSRRPWPTDDLQSGANEKGCQAPSFEATGVLWARPHYACTRPDLAGVTVFTGDAENRATADGIEGNTLRGLLLLATGKRRASSCSPRGGR